MMSRSTFCINARSFAAWTGCVLCAEIIGGGYLRSVITTIERRFTLPSATVALLSSSFQIGSLCVVVLISYFGSRYHRPRTMAIGCLLMMLGFFLTIVPQFVGDRYEFIDLSSNDTTASSTKHSLICKASANPVNDTVNCDKDGKDGAASNLYFFILVGTMICGVGASPIQPLGFSYIDDHATKHNAAFYIGLMSSIALVAPAIAFVLGSFTLKVWVDTGWVDTSKIHITPRDPGWVGAWWIGFIVAIVLLFFASLPLWFYPKSMEKEKNDCSNDSKRAIFNTERVKATLKVKSGGLLDAVKRLISNKRYLVIVAMWTAQGYRLAGVLTFSIKYLEVVFSKSASSSSFLIGTVTLPALVLGTVTGSFIIKHWKLEISGITKQTIISMVGSLVSFGITIFIGCETAPVAGLTVPYHGSDTGFNDPFELNLDSCNANCKCPGNVYTPVCAPNNITYVTPCHAGCSDFVMDDLGEIKNYTSCACLGTGGFESFQTSVTIGSCRFPDCENLVWPVIALNAVSSFFSGLHVTPFMVLLLRTLTPQDKAFGIGMTYFTFRVLAFLPGPILYGYVIDGACLFWTRDSCSDKRYCRVYDNVRYRYGYVGTATLFETVAVCITTFFYFQFARRDQQALKKDENKITTRDDRETRNVDATKLLPTGCDKSNGNMQESII